MNAPRDYTELARQDRVHVSLYSDPEVFEDEMQRIFYRSWVYVAHDSEIPDPGDFKTTFIGLIPVIVCRDEQMKIHVFINRCMHRGATVCTWEKGNTGTFQCPYHAWEYGLDGALKAVGMPRGYNDGEVDFASHGLVEAAKVDSYRGIIFASLLESPDISLDEKLGGAKKYIDLYTDLSPTSRLKVGHTGVYKHPYDGNWKIQVEGSVEGYHAPFTHATAFEVMNRKMGGLLKDYEKSGLLGLDVGHGNNVLQVYDLPDAVVEQRWDKEYRELLIDAHGYKQAMDAMRSRFNMVIFPNFAILEYQFRVIRPITPTRTEVRIYHTALEDVPRHINTRRVREHEFFYGPSSFGGPDDYAIFNRIQEGYKAGNIPWVLLNRGVTTERVDDQGVRIGDLTQETQQRAPYYEYRRLMAA